MNDLKDLKAQMKTARPAAWDQFPDIPLYMDQMISYMPRQLLHMERDTLTSAMVNNYIKDGLLPRAEGKRYGRQHLAYLTAICAMKPVLSMKEMASILGGINGLQGSAQEEYAFFLDYLDKTLAAVGEGLPDGVEEDRDLAALACSLALTAYANKLACQRVLDMMGEGAPGKKDPKDSKKEAKDSRKETKESKREAKDSRKETKDGKKESKKK